MVAHYFMEEVVMRDMNHNECESVTGGFRVIALFGALAAWAFANRSALVEIGQAADERDAELDAEHS